MPLRGFGYPTVLYSDISKKTAMSIYREIQNAIDDSRPTSLQFKIGF